MNGKALIVVAALLCVAAVAVAVVGVVVAVRARRRPAPVPGSVPADPFRDADADALRGDPRTLKPGDLVEIRGRSLAVRGSLRLSEGASTWHEHLLDDAAGNRVWLSVEEDPDLELVLWTQVPSATVQPGPPTVDFDGRRFVLEESGRAAFTGVGTTGLDPTGVVEYFDYAAPDGPLLAFERYGASPTWEVAGGEALHRAEVRIYSQGG